jgi:hypothetical protein
LYFSFGAADHGACGACGETSFGRKPEGKNHLKGMGVDGVMILKWILKIWAATGVN